MLRNRSDHYHNNDTSSDFYKQVLYILTLYQIVYEGLLVVIPGWETEEEEFAGGDYKTTIEGLYISQW